MLATKALIMRGGSRNHRHNRLRTRGRSRRDLSQLIRGATTARQMHRRVEVGASGQIIRARLLRYEPGGRGFESRPSASSKLGLLVRHI